MVRKDFPIIAKEQFDIEAVEYVNTFFPDRQPKSSFIEELNSNLADCFGIYHVTNTGTTSWHGLAEEIFRLAAHQDVVVQPISTEEYPTPAPRPAYTALNCSKLERKFGLTLPNWRDALARCIDSL